MNLSSTSLLQWMTQREVRPVDADDRNRTCLYYKQLLRAYQNFRDATKSNNGGQLNPFFSKALAGGNLLSELARILDFFVLAALNAEMRAHNAPEVQNKTPTLQQFYQQHIFDGAREFGRNIESFSTNHADMFNSIETVTNHFTRNIIECCTRVQADIQHLVKVFFRNNQPTGLSRIDATGSDFHKGGRQVLILTFDFQASFQVKLVYKPSDLEMDCLLVGKAASVNKIKNGFMTHSAAEIFNMQIGALHIDAVPLPTYDILPMDYRTMYNPGPPPFTHLREAYGYIEFLPYWDASESALNHYNDTPTRWENWGLSSFVLTSRQSSEDIIRAFYRLIGQWTAMACTFSMRDLHLENLIVHDGKPYLIDLENSLAGPVSDIVETALYDSQIPSRAPTIYNKGGVTGLYSEELVYSVGQYNGNNFQTVEAETNPKYTAMQNRLYIQTPSHKIVVPDAVSLLTGLHAGFEIISKSQQAMAAWWTRVGQVQVRAIPQPTSSFSAAISGFFDRQHAGSYENYLRSFIDQELRMGKRGDLLRMEKVVWAMPSTLQGLKNLDIPIFYKVCVQTDIVDSSGAEVRPVDRVTAPDNTDYTTGQTSFYQTSPTTALQAEFGQLQPNSTHLAQRVDAIERQVKQLLGVDAAQSTTTDFFEPVDNPNTI